MRIIKSILMHKNVEVAAIKYNNGIITDLYEILAPLHMPPGTYIPNMHPSLILVYLQAWQNTRAIPFDRENLQTILNASQKTVPELCSISHGMGLTDQYWIKNTTENICWENVNFHTNGFDPSMLTLLGSGDVTLTPDYETNGSLPKAWTLINRVPILLKDSPDWLLTASANEVVASRIAQLCGIEHAMYFPVKIMNKMVCGTPSFVANDSEEFVSLQMIKRVRNGTSYAVARQSGLDDKFLSNMTAFDLLIGNTDRHEGNFGVMLDADTMTFKRNAPLFDSGTSLHQQFGKTELFKPFFETAEDAWKFIKKINFRIPSLIELTDVITKTYTEFNLQAYAQGAIEELCKNAEKLRLLQKRR